MSLRLRRGPSTDRISIVFQAGELVYDTTEKKLYVGDDLTQGGIPVGDLLGDLSPQLGSNLDLNGEDIIGFGNINIDGDITATGTLTIPNIITDVQGSLFGDDSTPLVDGANNRLVLENNILADIGNVSVLPPASGNVLKYANNQWQPFELVLNDIDRVNITNPTANDLFIYDGSEWINSPLTGDFTGDVIGNVTGNVTGDVTGDVVGSVYSIDGSTLVLDAVTSTFIGDVIGDVTGNLTGNVTGSVYSDAGSLMINGIDKSIATNIINYVENLSLIDNGLATFSSLTQVTSDAVVSYVMNKSVSAGLPAINTTNNFIGQILFKTSDTFEERIRGAIYSFEGLLAFAAGEPLDAVDDYNASQYLVLQDDKLCIGGASPVEKLDVRGNAKINGFVQFGAYTTTERDDLTTTNNPQYATNWGMVIYNTTTNTFQGWANVGGTTPTWVDLS